MNSLAPLITESERLLSEAIKHFNLNVRMEELVVTIQSRGRKRALGWYAWDRWSDKPAVVNETVDGPRHEINLSAESLREHNMGETLLHELAHAENHKLGIKDCDKNNRVHNKKFKEMAEKLGLVVPDRDKKVGYGCTALGSEAEKFLAKIEFKRELFELFRLVDTPKEAVGSRMIKLQCPGCEYVVRTTKKWIEVGVPTCQCGESFEREEVGTEDAD